MPDWNVHIYTFGDLDLLKQAVASVPEGVPVHVFDGRHADFPGETDTTPGTRRFCGRHPDVRYHAPPMDRLPFGHGRDLSKRAAGYCKSRFVFERLPDNEWTLKLDADETLERFDVDLSRLNDEVRYCPIVADAETGEEYQIARLFKPGYWTPWVGDCLLPRELFPLETSLDRLARIWTTDEFRLLRVIRRVQLDEVEIANHDAERSEAYQRKRVQQLRERGREERADELAAEAGVDS